MKYVKTLINRCGLHYTKLLCKREYSKQQYIATNERPVEFEFLFRQLANKNPRTVLDVGTGVTALPHLMATCGFVVSAIDNIDDYWPTGMVNRHFHVIGDDITDTKLDEKFDFISCISTLEHIVNSGAALKSMFTLLNDDGHIVITCPYNEVEYIENVYDLPDSTVATKFPFVTQSYSRRELDSWMSDNGGEILVQEYWRFFTGKHWTCGDRVWPGEPTNADEAHQLTCMLIRKK